MQVTERSTAKTEEVAHARPPVERWLRWSGVLPLPVFLALHLGHELWLSGATDVSQVLRPPFSPFGALTSALLVWLPLTVHALLGVWQLTSREAPSPPPDDVPGPALLVSRGCSLVALAFLAYHAKMYPLAALVAEADPRDAGLRLLAELSSTSFGVPVRGACYLLGLAATVTHAGLALHRALLLEGLLPGQRRRRSAQLCAAGAAALFVLGAAAVIRVASGPLLR